MTEQVDKTSILKEMSTSYAALEDILSSLDKTHYVTEGVIPGWSIKDVIAHISSWHHRLYLLLDAALHNQEPAISGPDNIEELDALNAQFYLENKSLTLDEVLADFRNTYQHIMSIVQAIPEADLIDPQRFAWAKGEPLWKAIAGDTYEHYQEHILQIQQWLSKT
ncbi:MAG TPA: ClbS/DfsB family four-helix bundle protein [Ktedonobacteraceae bacterium]|nr:ClbS/DfsB family four-helix bundle protein [Ktedonobacteraceae bacterium]